MSRPIYLNDAVKDEMAAKFREFLNTYKMSDGSVLYKENAPKSAEKARITLSSTAWSKILLLVDHFDTEVGWHCFAQRISKGQYVISDVEVYPQKVTGVTVDSSDKYPEWLISHSDEEISRIRCQCHSHVNMSTSPSSTDLSNNRQYLEQLGNDDFYIFMIWNKKLETDAKIYDFTDNIYYEDGDIEIFIDEDVSIDEFLGVADEMVEKPSYKAPVTSMYGGSYYGTQYYGGCSSAENDKQNHKKKGSKNRASDLDYPGYGSYSGYYGGGTGYDSSYLD